jgi:hypothetical protein
MFFCGYSYTFLPLKVPEKILIGFPGVVATSDTAIIDQSGKVVDLASHVIRQHVGKQRPGVLIRFK